MPNRSLWVLEAIYSTLGNTALSHVVGETEGYQLRMVSRAGKGSTAGQNHDSSSPASWTILPGRLCVVESFNSERNSMLNLWEDHNAGLQRSRAR